jgi:HK97 family phage major capsid protein
VETIAGSNEWRGVSSDGITAGYAAEASEVDDDSPAFVQPTVNVERADAFVTFSFEIGGDWAGLGAEMSRGFSAAKDELEANKFFMGLGHGSVEPLGLITDIDGVAGCVVTGGAINDFTVDDLYAVEEDLGPRYRPLARFCANRAIYNKVRQFGSTSDADIWQRDLSVGLDNNAVGNTGATLLGYPAEEASEMDSTVTGGAEILLFGDFRHFIIVDRVGMQVETVQHIIGANRRPTGQRGLLAWWRNSSGVLAQNAFRLLVVASS